MPQFAKFEDTYSCISIVHPTMPMQLGVNQYIDISIRTGIRLSGDKRYIVLTIRQYNVGFENSTFNRRARSTKFKNSI